MMFMAPSSIHYIAADNSVITGGLDDRTLDLGCRRVLEQNGRETRRIDDGAKIQAVKKDGHWFTLNNASLQVYQRLERDGNCRKVKVDVVPLRSIPLDIRRMMVLPHAKVSTTCPADKQRDTVRDVVDDKVALNVEQISSNVADVNLRNSNIDIKSVSTSVTQDDRSLGSKDNANVITDIEDPSESMGRGYQKVGQLDLSDSNPYQNETPLDDTDSEPESEICSDTDSYLSDSECDWSQDECESTEDDTGSECSTDDEVTSSDDERECLL